MTFVVEADRLTFALDLARYCSLADDDEAAGHSQAAAQDQSGGRLSLSAGRGTNGSPVDFTG